MRDVDKTLLEQHPEIQYFGDALEDFTDTATLCELVDVVISVDTSVAHLAGMLGKPTWVLLSFSPDWRWLLDRDVSPWYPSIKLYRQTRINDWDSVLKRTKADLEKMVG
jgi:ADP-heptose:LPS heptosyltransferase